MTPNERLDNLMIDVSRIRAGMKSRLEIITDLAAKRQYPDHEVKSRGDLVQAIVAVEWLLKRPRVRGAIIEEIEAAGGSR